MARLLLLFKDRFVAKSAGRHVLGATLLERYAVGYLHSGGDLQFLSYAVTELGTLSKGYLLFGGGATWTVTVVIRVLCGLLVSWARGGFKKWL